MTSGGRSRSVWDVIKAIYEPQIQRDYGMTADEFSDYLDAHQGELPPLDSPVARALFGDLPACWPHFGCDHP